MHPVQHSDCRQASKLRAVARVVVGPAAVEAEELGIVGAEQVDPESDPAARVDLGTMVKSRLRKSQR